MQGSAAVTFDGANDVLAFSGNEPITTTTTAEQIGLLGGSFTVMGWVKANSWGGDQAIIGGSAADSFYLGIQNGRPIVGYGGSDTVMTSTIPTAEWVHVAWRYDSAENERAFFVNGGLISAETNPAFTPFTTDDTMLIGQARGGNPFGGSLDELVIYSHPLADDIIYNVANPLNTSVSKLELRVRAYENRDMGQFDGTWLPVTLDTSSALYTTWQHTLPALNMGSYKLDLRVTDSMGNINFVDGAWDVSVIRPNPHAQSTPNWRALPPVQSAG